MTTACSNTCNFFLPKNTCISNTDTYKEYNIFLPTSLNYPTTILKVAVTLLLTPLVSVGCVS